MGRYLEMAMRVPSLKAWMATDPATKATKATEVPLPPANDVSEFSDGGRRDYCRDLAPLYDWPRCEIIPGVIVLSGEANWLKFLDKADDAQVLAAIKALWEFEDVVEEQLAARTPRDDQGLDGVGG